MTQPIRIRTRDVLPIARVDLTRLNPALRHGVQQCISEANALIEAHNTVALTRTADDVLEGNKPQKRISRGTIWTAESLQPIRDSLADAIEQLEAHKNFTAGEPLEAEEIGKVVALAQQWVARAEDAMRRARDENPSRVPGTEPSDLAGRAFGPSGSEDAPHDVGPGCDRQLVADARTMPNRNYLPGSGRQMVTTAGYQAILRKGRGAATQDAKATEATAAATATARPGMFSPTPAESYAASLASGRKKQSA